MLKVTTLESHVEPALLLCEKAFGHLDLGDSSVRQELEQVLWARSVGVVDADTGGCEALILAAPMDLVRYAATEHTFQLPVPELGQLNGFRGDAMIVGERCRRLATRMMMRFLSVNQADYDYVWGTSHPKLSRFEFWQRHATMLGVGDDGEYVFALALTPEARATLELVQPALDETPLPAMR